MLTTIGGGLISRLKSVTKAHQARPDIPRFEGPIRRTHLSRRPWTLAQQTLRRYGISQRDIADEAGLPVATVNRALSLRFYDRTAYGAVMRMRAAAERLLREVVVLPIDQLWSDYPDPGDRP